MKDLNAINYFKSFIDSLYVLYNNSPKNKNEIKEICSELDIIFLKIGRVLDIRWVASSWRAVQAVWRTFPALCNHFLSSSTDTTKDSKSRSKYLGLYNKLCSAEFLLDLSLMCDVLSELSTLSLHLQKQTTTLLEADSSIKRTIRVIESFKNNSGDHMRTAEIAKRDMTFKNIKLSHFSKMVPINKKQFITSICNNLKERLLENEDDFNLVQDISIIDKTTWPSNVDIRYGEKEIKRLCQRFMLNKDNAINGFRVYLDSNGLQNTILELVNCIKPFPCSTADCERGFSLLNLICTDLRNKLTISNIANLMFLNINGPPMNQWNPEEYVMPWLISQHRDADDTRTKILKTDEPNIEYKKSLWKIL